MMLGMIEVEVLRALEPTFEDMVDGRHLFWGAYSNNLAEYRCCESDQELIHDIRLNEHISWSCSAAHQSAVDVATTLVALCPERYAGAFPFIK